MTYDDIIKSLEHTEAVQIAYNGRIVSGELLDEVINLIKLQQTEIKRLNNLIAEVNKYRGEVIQAVINIDKAKVETVKEFADKLYQKAERHKNSEYHYVLADDITDTTEEMLMNKVS